jgi:hypothetical protein
MPHLGICQPSHHAKPAVESEQLVSANTKFHSLNLFGLVYLHTHKIEIEVSLKYGITLMFQNIRFVVTMLLSSVTTSVPTFAKLTTSTR